MAKIIVQHHVRDYDAWKLVFDENAEVRRRHGATGHTLNRSVDDSNTLVIVSEFATVEGARAFLADPSLKEAMERGGVDVVPNVFLCEEAESVTY